MDDSNNHIYFKSLTEDCQSHWIILCSRYADGSKNNNPETFI